MAVMMATCTEDFELHGHSMDTLFTVTDVKE